jgi:hypothetical protein
MQTIGGRIYFGSPFQASVHHGRKGMAEHSSSHHGAQEGERGREGERREKEGGRQSKLC